MWLNRKWWDYCQLVISSWNWHGLIWSCRVYFYKTKHRTSSIKRERNIWTCVPVPYGQILIHPAHQPDPAHSLIWSLYWKNKWSKLKRQLYHWLRLVKPRHNISLLICLSINAKSTYLSLRYEIVATKKAVSSKKRLRTSYEARYITDLVVSQLLRLRTRT